MDQRIALPNRSMEQETSVRLYARVWSAARGFYAWLARGALRASGRAHGRMLDIACGPGFLPIAFARLAPEWEVMGADISAAMIAQARRRVEAAGLSERVKIIEGSALALPFEDASLDLVTMSNALHMIGHVDGLLAEVERVLVPGGVFFCQCYVRDAARPMRAFAWLNSTLLGFMGSELEGLYWVFRASYTAGEVQQAVAKRPGLEGTVRRRFGFLLLAELRKTTH